MEKEKGKHLLKNRSILILALAALFALSGICVGLLTAAPARATGGTVTVEVIGGESLEDILSANPGASVTIRPAAGYSNVPIFINEDVTVTADLKLESLAITGTSVYCQIEVDGGTLTAQDCTFTYPQTTENSYQAILAQDATVALTNCTFTDFRGHAVINGWNANLTIKGVSVTDCAVYSMVRFTVHSGNTILIQDSRISGNSTGSGIFASAYEAINYSVMIDNCDIWGNTTSASGGGVALAGVEVTIQNSRIYNNTAGYGGGIYGGGAILRLEGCEVYGNTAQNGGGIAIQDSLDGNPCLARLTIVDSEITGNRAEISLGGYPNTTGLGGGVYVRSGYIRALDTDVVATIHNSSIDGNEAELWGGGIYTYFSTLKVTGSDGTIRGNEAQSGGGIYANRSFIYLDGGTVSGNRAAEDGGGIFAEGDYLRVSGVIRDNYAGIYGGGIAVTGIGGILLDSATVSGNIAQTGGGIYQNIPQYSYSHTGLDTDTLVIQNGSAVIGNRAVKDMTRADTNSGKGGGIYVHNGEVRIQASEISDNRADVEGGGMYALRIDRGMDIANSLLACNSAQVGGGLYVNNPIPQSFVTDAQTVFAGNRGDMVWDIGLDTGRALYPNLRWAGENSVEGAHLMNGYDIILGLEPGALMDDPTLTPCYEGDIALALHQGETVLAALKKQGGPLSHMFSSHFEDADLSAVEITLHEPDQVDYSRLVTEGTAYTIDFTATWGIHVATGTIRVYAAAHTVTFVSNGSTVATKTVKCGDALGAGVAVTRPGYTFGGWFSDSACTRAYADFTLPVTQDFTLYAKWTAVPEIPGVDPGPTTPTQPQPTQPQPTQPVPETTQPTQPTEPGPLVPQLPHEGGDAEPPRPGGRDVPPAPANENSVLVEEDGVYIEYDGGGIPLGKWVFDDETESWVYVPIEIPLASIPYTGVSGLASVLALATAALTGALVMVGRKKPR